MIVARNLGSDGVVTKWAVSGQLKVGRKVDGVLETEDDGRDAWWVSGETGGVEPGDDDSGWDEVLEALNQAEEAA